jgi:ABC-type proline/glycine betaine transport system permease subunit
MDYPRGDNSLRGLASKWFFLLALGCLIAIFAYVIFWLNP